MPPVRSIVRTAAGLKRHDVGGDRLLVVRVRLEQPAPTAADAEHLVSAVGHTVDDRLDARVEPGNIAAASADPDAHESIVPRNAPDSRGTQRPARARRYPLSRPPMFRIGRHPGRPEHLALNAGGSPLETCTTMPDSFGAGRDGKVGDVQCGSDGAKSRDWVPLSVAAAVCLRGEVVEVDRTRSCCRRVRSRRCRGTGLASRVRPTRRGSCATRGPGSAPWWRGRRGTRVVSRHEPSVPHQPIPLLAQAWVLARSTQACRDASSTERRPGMLGSARVPAVGDGEAARDGTPTDPADSESPSRPRSTHHSQRGRCRCGASPDPTPDVNLA